MLSRIGSQIKQAAVGQTIGGNIPVGVVSGEGVRRGVRPLWPGPHGEVKCPDHELVQPTLGASPATPTTIIVIVITATIIVTVIVIKQARHQCFNPGILCGWPSESNSACASILIAYFAPYCNLHTRRYPIRACSVT